jgi:hypothetical protein
LESQRISKVVFIFRKVGHNESRNKSQVTSPSILPELRSQTISPIDRRDFTHSIVNSFTVPLEMVSKGVDIRVNISRPKLKIVGKQFIIAVYEGIQDGICSASECF